MNSDRLQSAFGNNRPDKEKKGNRTPPTGTTMTTTPDIVSLTSKYGRTSKMAGRRQRRYSWEVYDDTPDIVTNLSIKVSAAINEKVSASHLVRILLEEGMNNLEKELGLA